jgi:hypothetical protein
MPSGLTGDHAAAKPATSSWSVPPRAPPAKLVPPSCSPGSGRASPPPRPLRTVAEPRRRSIFPDSGRFPPPPRQPADAIGPPPFSDAWARTRGVRPRRLPSSWDVWASSPAAPRARRWAKIPPPPPGPANRESPLCFLLSFPIFTYMYIC